MKTHGPVGADLAKPEPGPTLKNIFLFKWAYN